WSVLNGDTAELATHSLDIIINKAHDDMCPHLWIKYHFLMEEFPGFSCSIDENRDPIGRRHISSLSKEKGIEEAETETRSNLGEQEEQTKDDVNTVRMA